MTELSIVENRRYEELLELAKQSYDQLGAALSEIRDKRLYRQHYGTFEAFVRAEFDKSREWAYKLIAVEKAVRELPRDAPRPKSARAARKLLPKRSKPTIDIEAEAKIITDEPRKVTPAFWASARNLAGDIKAATHFGQESLPKLKRATAQLNDLINAY